MNSCEIKILYAGDSALVVQFGNAISTEINSYIRIFVERLETMIKTQMISGISEWVPTFRSVSIYFDPLKISGRSMYARAACLAGEILSQPVTDAATGGNTVHDVPVCYDAEFAPDMETVCKHTGLTKEEVISLHSSQEYLIYMLGFLPGFVYLGGMDKRLETPRLKTPRLQIEAGSVGIAGSQTGIYPLESPGGWQLIGRTPIKLFDSSRKNPVLFKSGDYIKFNPITRDEYKRIAGKHTADEDKAVMESLTIPDHTVAILNSGAQSSVQDAGRYGYQKDGFSPSGVMDSISYRLANAIAGNKPGAAVLETTMLGPKLIFSEDTYFAITGADQQPHLNSQQIPLYTQVYAPAGSILTLGFTVTGLRSYIAFGGGIDVHLVLGSRSTSARYVLGGLKGRFLANNDKLPIGSDSAGVQHTLPVSVPADLLTAGNPISPAVGNDDENSNAAKRHLRDVSRVHILRIISGPQKDYFTRKALSAFSKSEYTISGESDRMGLRLTGPAVKTIHGSDIISDGIAYGSVQIASSGQPIIMAADRQTTGGYAKIGTVITADLPRLGQLKPGTKVRFKYISVRRAVKFLRRQEKTLNCYIRKLQRVTDCGTLDPESAKKKVSA